MTAGYRYNPGLDCWDTWSVGRTSLVYNFTCIFTAVYTTNTLLRENIDK